MTFSPCNFGCNLAQLILLLQLVLLFVARETDLPNMSRLPVEVADDFFTAFCANCCHVAFLNSAQTELAQLRRLDMAGEGGRLLPLATSLQLFLTCPCNPCCRSVSFFRALFCALQAQYNLMTLFISGSDIFSSCHHSASIPSPVTPMWIRNMIMSFRIIVCTSTLHSLNFRRSMNCYTASPSPKRWHIWNNWSLLL